MVCYKIRGRARERDIKRMRAVKGRRQKFNWGRIHFEELCEEKESRSWGKQKY